MQLQTEGVVLAVESGMYENERTGKEMPWAAVWLFAHGEPPERFGVDAAVIPDVMAKAAPLHPIKADITIGVFNGQKRPKIMNLIEVGKDPALTWAS